MSRIKPKLTVSSSVYNNNNLINASNNTFLTATTTATSVIDKHVRKNNRYALNELYNKMMSKSSTENFIDDLFKHSSLNINKIKLIDDLLNLSCVIADVELLDKIINFIQTTTIIPDNDKKLIKLTPNTIYYAIKGKNVEILKKLKSFMNDVLRHETSKIGDYLNSDYDETTLIRAIKNQQFEQVSMLVEEFGASLEFHDSKKRTPLHFAASFDNFQIFEYLIQKCVNLNAQCVFNDTPLINACLHRKYKNIEVLIKNGANIDLKGNYGNTAMHILVTEHNCTGTSNGDTNTPSISIESDLESINLLLKQNVDLCLKNDKEQTSFVRACATSNFNLCKLLLNELLKRYSKLKQPHSVSFSSSTYHPQSTSTNLVNKQLNSNNKLKVKTNFEFLNQEIVNGLLTASCYLRMNTVKYLFKYVNCKTMLCNELKEFFDNKVLITIIQRKDISEFSSLFKVFMSYDCYPLDEEKPSLFYINQLIKYWNIKLHIPSTYSFEPLEACIQELINLLFYYNKHSYQQLEQIYFDILPGVDENIILHSLCVSFRRRFAELNTHPKSLRLLSKNVIRKSVQSLSEKNLNSLNLPKALQDYLIDFK